MDLNDQPTEPWQDEDRTRKLVPPPPPPEAFSPVSQVGNSTQHTRRVSRRKLFGLAALGVAGAGALTAGGFALASEAQRGTWNPFSAGPVANAAQIGHLLRHGGFGATAEELNMYASLGFTGAVDRLLNYQQVSDDALESRLNALNLDLNKPQQQQLWWLLRMAWTQRPLLEKMTLFWSGVFTSSFRKVGGKNAYMRMIVQNNFLRTHAFDTFDNLLLGITADPAMLFYLDLTKSHKNSPNENYARESMELFTLGLGHYTQQDVYEGAAALTGWHVVAGSTTARYVLRDHNNLTKHYLGQTGNFDYKDVMRILANHPATPWFISRKLFTFFAYENPSNEDLAPLVDTYVKSGHNMGAVMRTLLLSPQFSSAQAYRSRLKSPAEYMAGAYRALNVQGDGKRLPAIITMMGQPLFDPPNVAGWPGDKVSSYWLNSGTWMTRLNYIDQLLVGNPNAKTGVFQPLDLQGAITANHIDSPEHFVDYFASFLLDGQLATDRRALLVDYFNTRDTSKITSQVTLTNGKSYPINRVRGTLYLMMTAPEYHLN
jgi:Protein of unknown function (DUF1800)